MALVRLFPVRKGARFHWPLGTAAMLYVLGLPTNVSAQLRSSDVDASAWPRAWLPVEVVDAVRTSQERPLPVYDDDGEIIPFAEIQAEIDPSGLRGAFWGALVGFSVGSALGGAMAPTDCGEVRNGYQYYCSPREDALNQALPGGLAIALGALGAWVGWGADHTSFEEALQTIRRRRRVTR